MPKAICDTSPLQYLHQLELLYVLPALTEGVIVPPAVADELATGRTLGVNLPDLVESRSSVKYANVSPDDAGWE